MTTKACLLCEREDVGYPLCGDCIVVFKLTLSHHSPENQTHGYDRCELCNFTRHPCDMYDAADLILKLVEVTSSSDFMFGKLWTSQETADFLGISTKSLKVLREDRGLPFIRPHEGGAVKYNPLSVREWVKNREKVATPVS